MKFQGKILTGAGDLIATIDNKNYHVVRDHAMYRKLMEAFRDNDADKFVKYLDEKQTVETYIKEEAPVECGVTVSGDKVLYNGKELDNAIVTTIRTMMANSLDFKPMAKFLQRAIQSGSSRVVGELLTFLEACGCTITEDGCFLAYKTVDSDYKDKYSHTVLNKVGSPIERKERWEVDDDASRTCSKGYHVGALAYAGPGGWYNSPSDHVMICKIAPEDVVAVPKDHSGQKLRCCWYQVVGEFKGELKPTVYSGRVGDDYSQAVAARQARIELSPDEMVIDGVYTAVYTSKSGDKRQRYFVVHERNHYDEYVMVELMEPEENYGGTRRFNLDSLSAVFEWDGLVESNQYEDDDEDDVCGDCLCSDCECDDEDDNDEGYAYGSRNYW